jgi:glycosyltransferase involved in cell wall biosynthesis
MPDEFDHMISVNHLCSSDCVGGAARATLRIHQALLQNESLLGLQSKIYAARAESGCRATYSLPVANKNIVKQLRLSIQRISRFLFNRKLKRFRTGNSTFHSFNQFPTDHLSSINSLSGDLFNLHWVGSDILSIDEISRLNRPVVWTLHDQWAFCGAEHYTSWPPGFDNRYIEGYLASNRPQHERGPDLNREIWLRKCKFWRNPMRIICPSKWLAACASQSAIMQGWKVHVIPYPIDTTFWMPLGRDLACKKLGLDPSKTYLVFGAFGGTEDPRKGGDLLIESLKKLKVSGFSGETASLELLIFGESEPSGVSPFPFKTHYFGKVSEDERLALIYCAGDVMLIPSRQDNLPNTGLEAQACGIPVICWEIGGMPDIVANQQTGVLVKPFDTSEFANAIHRVTTDCNFKQYLMLKSRVRALDSWSPTVIAKQYSDLYRDVIKVG